MRLLAVLLGLAGAAVAASHVIERAASGYWYEKIKHNGINPGASSSYVVFRNVKDSGAKGDGTTDDAAAIQKAINTVDGSAGPRTAGGFTGQPTVVCFPVGTYLVNSNIKNMMGTMLMGDPTSRPVLKAGAGFGDAALLNRHGAGAGGLVAFSSESKI